MNHRLRFVTIFSILCARLMAYDTPEDNTSAQFGWIDAEGARIASNIIPVDTNKGIAFLRVLDFDVDNNRYLVECINLDGAIYPSPDPALSPAKKP